MKEDEDQKDEDQRTFLFEREVRGGLFATANGCDPRDFVGNLDY